MMLALRATDQTSGLKLEKVLIPSIGPDDVLVKVAATGVTPGVVRLLAMGHVHVPTTVGHEIAGTIAAIGENVPSSVEQNGKTHQLSAGNRVHVHSLLSCQRCASYISGNDNMCQEGAVMGFAKLGKNPPLYDVYHDGGATGYVKVLYGEQLDDCRKPRTYQKGCSNSLVMAQ